MKTIKLNCRAILLLGPTLDRVKTTLCEGMERSEVHLIGTNRLAFDQIFN